MDLGDNPLQLEVPRKLRPLLAPCRYKGAYGGRGGAKSHFFAEQIVVRCFSKPTRVVCIREVQKAIRDSVRQLILDKISKFGIGSLTASERRQLDRERERLLKNSE